MQYVFTLFLTLLVCSQVLALEMHPKEQKVAIIGAGLAGLTAAYRLHQKGYDVEVYEGRNRVGGRVQSVRIQNLEGKEFSVEELGGQNIADGGEAKNFFALAKELNLEIIRDTLQFTRAFYDGNKLHGIPQLLKEKGMTEEEFAKAAFTIDPKTHSIQDLLDRLFKEGDLLKRFITVGITAYEGSPPASLALYHNIETLHYMVLGGVASAHKSSGEVPTIHRATLKGGNALLPLALANSLPGCIHLGKVLKKAAAHEKNQIQLTFKDGTATICNKLILAMPCSVYEDIDWDGRILPSHQLEQIKNVQYGTVGKILIPAKSTGTHYIGVFCDKMVTGLTRDGSPLFMFVVGENGTHLKKNANNFVREHLKAIKAGFNNVVIAEAPVINAKDENFTQYTQPVAKSWAEDPYSKGSYANYGRVLNEALTVEMEYRGVIFKKIFEPIDDRVFIIGEHATILDEIGTLEAAVETGERVAKVF